MNHFSLQILNGKLIHSKEHHFEENFQYVAMMSIWDKQAIPANFTQITGTLLNNVTIIPQTDYIHSRI